MKIIKKALAFFVKYYGTIVGTGVVFIATFFVWTLVWPFVPAKVNSVEITNTVQSGGQIEYVTNFCRYVDKGTRIERHRYLVAEDKTLSSPIELSDSPIREVVDDFIGCKKSEPVKLPVETGVPSGKYRLTIQLCYYVVPWRCVQVEGRSEVFEISKPNIETQLGTINQKINEVNEQLKQVGSNTVVNTLFTPIPQTIIPPFQEAEPTQPRAPTTPVTPTKTPESCLINIIGIKLQCNRN